jgi:hypothetical protein
MYHCFFVENRLYDNSCGDFLYSVRLSQNRVSFNTGIVLKFAQGFFLLTTS